MSKVSLKIETRYATFEQAKWLKEIGFDIKCTKAYAEERLIDTVTGGDKFTGVHHLVTLSKFHKIYFYAPEQWMIVEWLRINHGIWTFPDPVIDFSEWTSTIVKIGSTNMLYRQPGFYSPQAAYSAAFDYIKNNLILSNN